MKRMTTGAALWLVAALQTMGSTNYTPSKSSTGNFVVVQGGQQGSLQRYSTGGRLLDMIAAVPNAIAVAKSGGNYMVVTGTALVQVTPAGSVTTIANAPKGKAGVSGWIAIVSDQLGNLVVVDNIQHAVLLITPGSGSNVVTKVANYVVAETLTTENAAVAMDPDGNYLVLEDNAGAVRLLLITPAGAITPIQFRGATPTQCHTSLAPFGGGYLFVSPAENAVFELQRVYPTLAAQVTQVASDVASSGTVTSVAADQDSGDVYVTTSTGPVMHISGLGLPIKSTSNATCTANCFINQVANVPAAFDMIAETHGDLPHLVAGGVWTTGVYILNTGFLPASYLISFFDDSGNPAPLPFPSGNSTVLQGTLPPQTMKYIEAANPQGPLTVASGLINADPTITVQALFRESAGGGNYYEAGMPSSGGGSGFAIPFDATTFTATGAPVYTGFAIANLDLANAATVTCTATDQTGAVIPNAVMIPVLPPLGHYANYLFPALTGNRGTINCSSTTTVAAVALRFLGAAFSSLPVLY
jgi:hypothetical protein